MEVKNEMARFRVETFDGRIRFVRVKKFKRNRGRFTLNPMWKWYNGNGKKTSSKKFKNIIIGGNQDGE